MPRFPLPSSVRPQRWDSALVATTRGYDVAADITGAPGTGAANRNGLAVGKPTHNDLGTYSGIGRFTDRWGNTIWVTEDRGGKYALFDKHQLWGRRQPYILPLQRFFGAGEAGENALLLLPGSGRDTYPTQNYSQFNADVNGFNAQGRPNNSMRYYGFKQKYGVDIAYRNLGECLTSVDQLCQKINGPVDRPIVVLLVGNPTTWQTIAASFVQIFTIISTVIVPFAGKLPIAGLQDLLSDFQSVVDTLSESAEFIASGGVITASNVGEFILPIARKITPNTWANTLNDGVVCYQAASRGDYRTLGQQLGVSVQAISGYDIRDTIAQVDILSQSAKSDANAILGNFNALRMIDNVGKWAQEPEAMLGELLRNDSQITGVPFLQDLFCNASGGSAVQMIPNLQNVVSLALHHAADSALDGGGPDLWAQMALQAVGWPVDDTTYDGLAYSAIRQQVRQAKRLMAQLGQQLQNFQLPVTIPNSKRAAFAQYLAEDEHISVDANGGGRIFIPYAEWI